ncbi:MAG: hypothetical protein Q4B70_11395 [Lachnospiraceae bacterium]|nr:hypothetical protein [Lachnospiraceae bacterium]
MTGMEILNEQIQIYHTVSVLCVFFFLLFLITDIVLFRYLRIDKVFGYLTGRTEKKSIEIMMQNQRNDKFEVIKSIVIIHTEEDIEKTNLI